MAVRKRTSYERQVLAVNHALRTLKDSEALRDASFSLLTLDRIQRELLLPEPDMEKIAHWLECLLVP